MAKRLTPLLVGLLLVVAILNWFEEIKKWLTTNKDWLAVVIPFAGSLLVVAVAIWRARIEQWLWGPKLSIDFDESNIDEPFYKTAPTNIGALQRPWPPDKHWIFNLQVDATWLRVRIRNAGKSTARNCYGKLTDVRVNGERQKQLDPIFLHWVGNPPVNEQGASPHKDIPPEGKEWMDLCFIAKGGTLKYDLHPTCNEQYTQLFHSVHLYDALPFRRANRTAYNQEGEYSLEIIVYADDCKPIRRTILFDSEKIKEKILSRKSKYREQISRNEYALWPARSG